MSLFHQVQDAHVVLQSKGVWRQATVFEHDGALYAKWGSGFIGLRMHFETKGTTLPSVIWSHLEGVNFEVERGTGKMLRSTEIRKAA